MPRFNGTPLEEPQAPAQAEAEAAPVPKAPRFGGAPLAGEYEPLIEQAAVKYGLPVDKFRRQVEVESNFDPMAVSKAGARGLTQLMPGTAKDLGVTDPHDPAQSIDGGARYMRQMLDMFGGDYSKALSAYNRGPGNERKYGDKLRPKETQNYLKKIMGDFEQSAAAKPVAKAGKRDTTIAEDVARGLMGFQRGFSKDLPNAVSQGISAIIPDSAERFMDVENKTIAERIADEEAFYNKERERLGGQGFDPGRLAGNVVNPASLALGAGTPSLLGAAGRGAAGALMQPVEGTTAADIGAGKLKQGVSGAILGPIAEGAGRVITKGAGRIAGAIKNELSPEAARITAQAKELGIPITAGNASPRNKILTGIEGSLENVRLPGVSLVPARERTAEAAGKAAQRLVDDQYKALQNMSFNNLDTIKKTAAAGGPRSAEASKLLRMIDQAGDDEKAIMQVSGNLAWFRKKLSADKLYNEADRLAGDATVAPTNALTAIDNAIKKLPTEVDSDSAVGGLLSKWKTQLEGGVAAGDDDAIADAVNFMEGTVGQAPTQLPRQLAGATPRYNFGNKAFGLHFENDIDKAAYISAQATPSAKDADYLNFAKAATGMTDSQIRRRGEDIKAAIKAQAAGGKGGETLTVPAGSYPTPPAGSVATQGADSSFGGAAGEVVPNTLARMRRFHSSLQKRIEQATTDGTTDSGRLFLVDVAKAVNKDMEDFTDASPALKDAASRAKSYYEQHVVPYQARTLAKALTSKDPDKIYGSFIKAQAEGKGDYAAKNLFKALDEKGRQAVRYGIAKQAMENASTPNGFSPTEFAKTIDSTEYSQYFRHSVEHQRVKGLSELFSHLGKSTPEHLMKYAPVFNGMAGLGLVGAGTVSIPGAAAAYGSASFLRWLMTSEPGKRVLLSANVLGKGGSQEKMGALLDKAARQFGAATGVTAGAEAGNQGRILP